MKATLDLSKTYERQTPEAREIISKEDFEKVVKALSPKESAVGR